MQRSGTTEEQPERPGQPRPGSGNVVARANPADEIAPGLWLGSRYAALDGDWLRANKIEAVFNCTKDIPFDSAVMRRYRVPVDDNLEEAEIRNLELWSHELVFKLATEIRQAQAKGRDHGVLVHCAAGMQRSAASVAMYLIAVHGMTTSQAMFYIKSKRSIAFFPKANFEKAMRGFEASYNRDIRPRLGDAASPAAP